jgi:hypothetical protein
MEWSTRSPRLQISRNKKKVKEDQILVNIKKLFLNRIQKW